jgi:PAS domain S-box-containing protein
MAVLIRSERIRMAGFALLYGLLSYSLGGQNYANLLGLGWFCVSIGIVLVIPFVWFCRACLNDSDCAVMHENDFQNIVLALDQSSAIVVTDLHGRFTAMNDKWCEISGYSKAELLGKTHRLMSSDLHPKSFFQNLFATIQAGHVWQDEICNRSKEGDLFWAHTIIFPFRGKTGEIEKYVAMLTDVTVKKLNESELQSYRDRLEDVLSVKKGQLKKGIAEADSARREFERYKYVFDHHACVIVSDLDGRVTYCNDRFSQVSGYTREEFIGENYRVLNRGLPQFGLTNQMLKAISRGEVWYSKICHRAKDGQLFWVDATVSAFLDDEGKVRQYIAAWTDITDRIRAIEDAEIANRAKSNFLSTMSHELRTPMNGVVGMVDVLQKTPLTASQQRMMNTIHNSSLTLLKIFNDILDFSKIEANQLDLEHIPVCLEDIIRNVTQLMDGVARSKNIKVTTFIDPTLPVWILSDSTRLSQILFNLIGNALKFIDRSDGAVTISLNRIVCSDGSEELKICVKDNGIGMSEADQVKLFQPFQQVDSSIARKFGGTGLGLSITQKLVFLMQGKIYVKSTLGQGSEFIVQMSFEAAKDTLPRPIPQLVDHTVVAKLPTMAAIVNDVPVSARLILLAEDNAVNREVLQAQLALLGYACEVAVDGVEALALWRSGRFVLLLTDCNMPNMDGFELTGEIRQLEVQGTRIPIVAVTANAMMGEAQRCRDRGMDDYLSKPIRLVELDAMLKLWMPDKKNHFSVLQIPVPVAFDQPHLRIWDIEILGHIVGDNLSLQHRLLSRFLVTTNEQVSSMQLDVSDGAFMALADKAHALKSASRSVGALVLGELCEGIEAAGLAADGVTCKTLSEQLPHDFAAVSALIHKHLAPADNLV